MGPVEPHEVLAAARIQAGMSIPELWLAYLALGGNASPLDVRDVLDGIASPSRLDFDILGQALNERFLDRGLRWPVPDARDVGL